MGIRRRYAVVDTKQLDADGDPIVVLETNDLALAQDYLEERGIRRALAELGISPPTPA